MRTFTDQNGTFNGRNRIKNINRNKIEMELRIERKLKICIEFRMKMELRTEVEFRMEVELKLKMHRSSTNVPRS